MGSADPHPPAPRPERVFISYSPVDINHLNMLLLYLRTLERLGLITIFTHEALPPGTLWHETTQAEISNTAVAILLVTQDYLDSEALMEDELPKLLARAEEEDGTAILPLLVRPSMFAMVPYLYRFKPFNPYRRVQKTLVEMERPGEKERFLVTVADAVAELVQRRRGSAGY